MHRKRLSVLMCALVPALGACGGSATQEPYETPPPAATAGDEMSEPATEPEPAAELAPEPEPAAKAPEPPPPPTPTVGAVLTFKVKDYAEWKAKFDEGEADRAKAGVIGHAVSVEVDADDSVILYLAATDADKLKQLVSSKELKGALKEAGAKGKPKVTMMVHGDSKPADGSMAAAMITHPVKDFDAWKEAFDAHDETRQEAGITGYSVSQDPKDPKKVHVYLQADNVETLQEFAKSEDLKNAMKEAGVKGKPKITFMTQEEMKFYPPQPETEEQPEAEEQGESAPAEKP